MKEPKFGKVFLIFSGLILLLTIQSCATSPEIDAQTGMAINFCDDFSSKLTKTNETIWELLNFKVSIAEASEQLVDLSSDSAAISIITNDPATSWLTDIGRNAGDFLNFFSASDATSEELTEIYGMWNTNFKKLSKYCP